jgi:hypothetical protein
LLKSRIDALGNCTKILGGASIADFEKVAGGITFYDGRPDSQGSGRTQNTVSGNGNNTTLAATVQYDIADTLTKNGTPIAVVVLGRDFYFDTSVSQADTLLHEALHVALGLGGPGDQDLKSYLSRYGFTSGYGGTGGTDDITQWLKANCPGGK